MTQGQIFFLFLFAFIGVFSTVVAIFNVITKNKPVKIKPNEIVDMRVFDELNKQITIIEEAIDKINTIN